jgi:hypothetical protein
MSKKLRFLSNVILLLVFASCASKPKLGVDEAWDRKADAERIRNLSSRELEWEKRLEKKLTAEFLTEYKNKKLDGKETPWDFVEDDPSLPRVLLVGDFHSILYTSKVRKKLKGIASVHRVLGDCSSSVYGVKNIKKWVNPEHWDLIHFNFGYSDKEKIIDGDYSLHSYVQNIRKIVFYLKQTKAKLIWSSTIPTKPREISLAMNIAAKKTMDVNKVFVNDVYSQTLPYVNLDQKYDDQVNDDAINDMADSIAEAIKSRLKY